MDGKSCSFFKLRYQGYLLMLALAFPAVAVQLPCKPCIDRPAINITAVVHGMKSSDWWRMVQRGALAAGYILKINLDYSLFDLYDSEKMAVRIREVIKQRPDALLVTIPKNTVHEAIKEAIAAGIPVFSLNSGYHVAQELGIKAHVGMHEYNGGLFSGRHYSKKFEDMNIPMKQCIAISQEAGNTAMDQRGEGFKEFCTSRGATTTIIEVNGASVDAMREVLTDRFQEMADAGTLTNTAILSLGTQPSMVMIEMVKQFGVFDTCVLGTFDLNPDIYEAIGAGELLFGIDQQNFIQGLLPVFLATIYATTGQLMAPEVYMSGPSYVLEKPSDRKLACHGEAYPICECPWAGGDEALVPTSECKPLGDNPLDKDQEPKCDCFDVRQLKFRGVTHAAHHPFWYTVRGGSLTAARDFRLADFQFDLWEQFSTKDMADKIKVEAVDPTIDGIFVSIAGGAVPDAITEAAKTTTVVSINSGYNVSKNLDPGTGRIIHHVGQDEYVGGFKGAKLLKNAGATHIIVPKQEVQNPALEQRAQGAIDFAKSSEGIGLKVTVLEAAKEINVYMADEIRQYISDKLDEDQSINGILFLNSKQCDDSLSTFTSKGRGMFVGTFDNSATTAQAITDKHVLFAIDQLPWMQGYGAVLMLVLKEWTGLQLADHVIGSGPSFITSPDPVQDECYGYYFTEDRVGPYFADEFATTYPVCEFRPPIDCDPGMYLTASNDCAKCPNGTFKAGRNQEKCMPCHEGTFVSTEGNVKCSDCGPGKFASETGSITCEDCPVATYGSSLGSSECAPCDPGTFADTRGRSMCRECTVGTFQPSSGRSACLACAPRETTLQMAEVAGKSQYILFAGASSEDDCGCEIGFRPQGDSCVECVEGLDCRGKSDIWVKEGFSAGIDLSVFKCYNNHLRCPGGRPGASCATNREGISCAECASNTAPQDDGTCIACEGPDSIVFIFVVILFTIALVLIYWLISTNDHTKTNHAALFCALNLSITVTLVQQLGVISFVSLEWPEPLGTILSVVRLLNFDIEVLRFNCVVSAGPFDRFFIKVCILAIGVVALLIIHSCFVIIKHKGNFKGNRYALIGSLGTLFMVFYISVVSAVIAPLQCVNNPNGKWTVRGYQSVQCWTSEGDHTSMVAVGLLALLIPLGYLIHCGLTVKKFSREMRAGHVGFLRSYAFLFSRYRVEVYWYSVVHMLRSLLMSLVPVFPYAVVQIFGLQIITMSHLCLVITMKPWRVGLANILEGVFASGILLMLTVGAIAIQDASLRPVAWIGVILVLCMFACMPVCLGYGMYSYFVQKSVKPFHFFICHHKAGAGCFARLLKLVLSAHTKVTKKVFIDCDDLRSLDLLFDYVGFQSDICVVVCSKEILLRQWCMGELVTAKHQNTFTTRVLWSDFVEPTPEFIESYAENVEISGLAEHGISLSMVQDALRWVPSQQKLQLPQSLSEKTVINLADRLVQAGINVTEPSNFAFEPDKLNPSAQTAILVDNSNCETQSSALVLKMHLLKFTSHAPNEIPFILPDDVPAPKSTKIVLIMCTAGALQQPNFLKALISAGQLQNKYVPILANESFRFPTNRFLEESKAIVDSVTSQPQELLSLILSVFKSIAVVFQPEVYSSTEEILQAQSSQIAVRLGNSGRSLAALYFPPFSRQPAKSDMGIAYNSLLKPPANEEASQSTLSYDFREGTGASYDETYDETILI